LLTWATLTNFNATNPPVIIRDPAATNKPMRFNRAAAP
jgi:hypothetical protein